MQPKHEKYKRLLALCKDTAAGVGPRISSANTRVAAWVIPTNEELMIARHTPALVGTA